MTTELTVTMKMDINPAEGQTPEEARAELLETLTKYVAGGPDCPFLTDLGPQAWGGYDGPTVASVTVTEQRAPEPVAANFADAAALLNLTHDELDEHIRHGEIPVVDDPTGGFRVRVEDIKLPLPNTHS